MTALSPPLDPSVSLSDVRSRIGTTVAGRYRLLRMIGEGGMGAVFEAEASPSGARVAVKLIKPAYAASPEVNARFLQEVQVATSIGHPNIVRVLDAGTDASGPYIVLELLMGETLCDVLERRTLGPREALGVMAATLEALGAAHAVGVVHRDIKPENIFLLNGADRCTGVKLLDFGISKILSMQSAGGGLTRAGMAVGTPDYMSPEQAGGGRVDGRADLWSVGAVLYEAIARAKPFEGESYQQLVSRIILMPHIPLQQRVPAAPRGVCDLIDRALRKEAGDRYPSAEAMVADVRHLLATLPSDEAMGFHRVEIPEAQRAGSQEPTQILEAHPAPSSKRPPERRLREPDPTPTRPLVRPKELLAPIATASVPPPPPRVSALPAPPASVASAAPAVPESRISRDTVVLVACFALALVLGVVITQVRARMAARDANVSGIAPPPPLVVHPPPVQQTVATPTQPLAAPHAPPPALAPQESTPTVTPPRVSEPSSTPRIARVAPPPVRRTMTASPVVETGAPLDSSEIIGGVRSVLPQLRGCARAVPSQPYTGAIQGELDIDARGAVQAVRMISPTAVTVPGRCMVNVLRGVRYPAGRPTRAARIWI
jgi:serine/threonine-protein kinase